LFLFNFIIQNAPSITKPLSRGTSHRGIPQNVQASDILI
jgi:hypothetical protein